MERSTNTEKTVDATVAPSWAPSTDAPINASGHRQELDRNFNLLSICSLAITSGNTWITLGGAVVSTFGYGRDTLYLTVPRPSRSTMAGHQGSFTSCAVSVPCSFGFFAHSSTASPLPSFTGLLPPQSLNLLQRCRLPAEVQPYSRPLIEITANAGPVYHWASVTAGRYGRICGWFAGWWNFLAWIVGLAATLQIIGAQTVSMYSAFHPTFVTQRWHVFVSYIICTWITCFIVLFANRALPTLEAIGGFLILAGVLITIIVCAVMPHARSVPYATTAFVWRDWVNSTGYPSNGFVFLLGMLNGAFSVGTPDIVSHLAEEIPRHVTETIRASAPLTP